jgi:hypothetical protein
MFVEASCEDKIHKAGDSEGAVLWDTNRCRHYIQHLPTPNICSTGFFHQQLEHLDDLVPVLSASIFALFHSGSRKVLSPGFLSHQRQEWRRPQGGGELGYGGHRSGSVALWTGINLSTENTGGQDPLTWRLKQQIRLKHLYLRTSVYGVILEGRSPTLTTLKPPNIANKRKLWA